MLSLSFHRTTAFAGVTAALLGSLLTASVSAAPLPEDSPQTPKSACAAQLSYAGDPDGDGFANWQEWKAFSDPCNPDSDQDGLVDGSDPWPLSEDGDGDQLPDAYEISTGVSDSLLADTDSDGLEDGEEVFGTRAAPTNPLFWDTDGDYYSDGYEADHGTDPNDSYSVP